MATIDPKLIIGAALAVPVAYIWQEWEWSFIFLIGLAGYAWYTFDNQYIHKSEARHREVPQMGPQQPFMPQDKEWFIDQATGEPVARYQPPSPHNPQQRPR